MAAVNVRHALRLDRVLLTVANVPWQKVGSRPLSPAEDRLAMVEAAVAEVEGLEASDLELVRGGDSYTVDTVEQLLAEDPSAELFVIVGQDAAAGMPTWERIDDLRAQACLVVVERPGVAVELPDRLVVPAGGGAPAGGVQHRPARPGVRRSPARLPVPPATVACMRQRRLYREACP